MHPAAERVRVFLVEGSPLVRKRLEAMLTTIEGASSAGHAQEATEAIRAILAEHPDAVVCDLQLSEGSGFDVLRAVREGAPEIDVYILSNFATEPCRRLAARLGARAFFDKSSEFERLHAALAARAPRPTH